LARVRAFLVAGAIAFGLMAGGVADAASGPAPARPDPNQIRPDPAVVQGVLPNGLRYWVMRNATPAHGLSIRLVVDAGFYDEADDEVEAAHFVEHMAFRNPLSLAGADIAKTFQSMGVGFGRDQNAATSLYSTTYQLDLPSTDGPLLDMSFRWLRDIGDGINFSQEQVTAERGVILAERQSDLSTDQSAREQMAAFEGPGLRTTARLRLNSVAEISALGAPKLQAFYQRWYRPENAMLIVVGDLPVEALQERIRQTFGSWRGQGAATPRRPYGAADPHRAEDVQTLAARTVAGRVRVCRAGPADPSAKDDMPRLRLESARAAWRSVLAQRLTAILNAPSPPFLTTDIESGDGLKEARSPCLEAVISGDDWAPALRALQLELRRFDAFGPSQAELDSAVDETRSTYRGGATQASTRRSADLAAEISEKALDGGVVATPAEAFRDYDTAVETLTPAEVTQAFRKDWSTGGPLLFVVSPNPPSPEEVRRAWAEGEAAPAPGRAKAEDAPSWAYHDFGPAGRVVSREPHPGPGFVRFRFANGVVLNFKQTAFTADSVSVRVSFGAGRREIPSPDYVASVFGAELFPEGGLGRHSYSQIARMYRDNEWSFKLSIGDEAFSLSSRTTRGGLDDELNLLTAFVTDPGFRPDVDARLKAAMETGYRSYRTNLELVLSQAVIDTVAAGSPGQLPPWDKLEQLRMADFARILKPALISDPLEVTVVGDVDEKSLLEIMSKTFAALPARPAVDRRRPDTWFLRYPKTAPPTIRTTHEGSKDRAMVGVVWPLYVAAPARRREEIALDLLGQALRDALMRRLRVELGKTYAPDVEVSMPDGADQGEMMAVVEAAPGEVEAIATEIRRLAQKVASGDLPDDSVEAARAPLLTALQSRYQENAFWALGLNGSARRDPDLADFLSLRTLFQTVTPAEVRKAAADWLSATPIVVIAMPEASAASQGAAK
jgi:zinc protease